MQKQVVVKSFLHQTSLAMSLPRFYSSLFSPGATIAGAAFLPLLQAVQEYYPGSLWVGATSEWGNEMPNPLEIGGQITKCLDKAAKAGYSTYNIYFGGHSLGGIVLESYISGHSKIANGIALLGTWLPDLLGEKPLYANPLWRPIPCQLFQGQQ